MDGPLFLAIRVMHHYLLSLPTVHTVHLLRRRQFLLFILAIFAILAVDLLLLVVLPAGATLVAHLPRAAHAASLQTTAACQELLVNGNLETSGGWRFGATPAPGTIVDTPVHGGAFAIRLGIGAGANPVAYSTAYQTVTLPATAEQILLTYWERPGATGDSGDYREVIALRTDFTVLRSLTRQSGAGNDQWTQRTFDLSDLRGQTIVLYFNLYNNGSGATLVNYLDDSSLQSCDSTTPATPTATAPATGTPTPTPTATTPVTPAPPTPTATATPLPSSVLVQAGSVTVAEGQNDVTVPLTLLGATAERAVGVLQVTIQYDAAVLQVTSCTVGDSFDLLLCHTATPGVVRLAGVAATGIRATAPIANFHFALRQPASLPTQLTVPLATVADGEGAALTVTGQSGQIKLACDPGRGNCQALFLPLVNR